MSSGRSFAKLVGAGNDFLFVDCREEPVVFASARAELARRVCDRHFGVGADGLVFVENGSVASGADLRWDFYNSDGSSAEMCGNAARCLTRWASLKLGRDAISFETIAGVVRGALLPSGGVEVELPFVSRASRTIEIDVHGQACRVLLYDTGVPHATLEAASIASARGWNDVIQRLRWLPEAGERGANVTFFARGSEAGVIDSATFERGVEGFTLACGTGVIAAALAALEGRPETSMRVRAPGGELEASFDSASAAGVRLKGPADFVCDGEFAEELFR